MKDKHPEIYKSKIEKLKSNIQNEFYYHKKDDVKEPFISKEELREKISKVFLQNDYVYKADINIMLKNGENIIKKVIALKDDYLITLDNERISLDEIADIK